MDRALQANIIAKSGKSVELAGDVDVVLLDKTGTITIGNRNATKFLPIGKKSASDVGRLAALASAADDTPGGEKHCEFLRIKTALQSTVPQDAKVIPFSARVRMSGLDLPDGHRIRKGAPDAIIKFVEENHGKVPGDLNNLVTDVASKGATPLAVAEDTNIVGVIVLEDILKPNMSERFARLGRWALEP